MALTTLTTGPSALLNGSISIPASLLDPTATAVELLFDVSSYAGSTGAMSLTADYSLDNGATWNFLGSIGLNDPNFVLPANLPKVSSLMPNGSAGIIIPVTGVGNLQRMIRSTLTTTASIKTSMQIVELAIVIPGSQSSPPGSVGVDATGTASLPFNNVTSFSFTNLTIGASATALIATVAFNRQVNNTAPTAVALTWNAVSMTLVPSATADNTTGAIYAGARIFGLASPATGNKTLAGSWTTAMFGYVDAISFTGTDTSTPFANGNAATGTSTTPGVTITSATGNEVVAVHSVILGASPPAFNSVDHTQLFLDNSGGEGNGAGNYATGAATVALASVLAASGQWASAGCSIVVPAVTDVLQSQVWM
jgi:hypothetical protein